MNINYMNIFSSLGYDVESVGYKYMEDLIEDVRGLLDEGKTEDEIKELLPRYKLEYYHFFYEVGKRRYDQELVAFCNREHDKISPSRKKRLMNKLPNMDVDTTIIYFARYFDEKNKKEIKKLVKESNM